LFCRVRSSCTEFPGSKFRLFCEDGSTEVLGTAESVQVAFWEFSKMEICLFKTSAVFLVESFFAGVWSEAQPKIRKVELKMRNPRKLRSDFI